MKKSEIGSEFWDIPLTNCDNGMFEDVTWFISGRAALRAILQEIKMQIGGLSHIKIALPSYLCESMILPLEKEEIEYSFYPIDVDGGVFKGDFSNTDDCNVVLLIDYFGFETILSNFSKRGKIIIRDLTHSIFTKAYDDADYYFGSLRKWTGFKCGGFAYSKTNKIHEPTLSPDDYVVLRHKAMDLKKEYISGSVSEKKYLDLFSDAERLLDSCEIAHSIMSDIESAKLMDVEYVKKARRRNAKFIIDELSKYCIVKDLNENDCPLFVPILYKDRDGLRQYLKRKDIYCPIHWPNPLKEIKMSNSLYEQELSLVCDQRYSTEDMRRMINEIKNYIEKE